MALTKALQKDLTYPPCINEFPRAMSRAIAKEIFESYESLKNMWPTPLDKSTQLWNIPREITKKQAKLVVQSVYKKRDMVSASTYNSEYVKFIGCAAGALEALRLASYDPWTMSRFHDRMKSFVSLFSGGVITPIRLKIDAYLVARIFGFGVGEATFSKGCGVLAAIEEKNGVKNILSFRMTDVDVWGTPRI